jgi:RHS repeat-associated protein
MLSWNLWPSPSPKTAIAEIDDNASLGIAVGTFRTTRPALIFAFQYTARESDSETGLYFFRARYFDQSGGRFLSEDPTKFGGGVNFYPYVDSSPTNDVDPLGLVAGAKEPRVGTRCKWGDTCNLIKGKMLLLERTISSHQGWDWTMPSPRGGARHVAEIANYWRALARCFNIYRGGESFAKWKKWMERLYRAGDEQIKRAIVDGILEHLFDEKG